LCDLYLTFALHLHQNWFEKQASITTFFLLIPLLVSTPLMVHVQRRFSNFAAKMASLMSSPAIRVYNKEETIVVLFCYQKLPKK
jgi:hypothetical protein